MLSCARSPPSRHLRSGCCQHIPFDLFHTPSSQRPDGVLPDVTRTAERLLILQGVGTAPCQWLDVVPVKWEGIPYLTVTDSAPMLVLTEECVQLLLGDDLDHA